MKTKIYWLLLCLLIACASPKKSLQNKNFNAAYKKALRQLKKQKNPLENQLILTAALKEITNRERKKIEALKSTGTIKKQIEAIKVNNKLREKIDKASPYTDAFVELQQTLQTENDDLHQSIYQQYFKLGEEDLANYYSSKRKTKAQSAYYNFKKSKNYGNPDPNLNELLKTSLSLGLVVYNIKVETPYAFSYSWKINSKLSSLSDYANQFLEVNYSSFNSAKEADCQITIVFYDLDIDLDENTDEKEDQKTLKYVEITTDDDGNEIETKKSKEVSYNIITETKHKTAIWQVAIEIVGANNCSLSSTSFTEEFEAVAQKISHQGPTEIIENGTEIIQEEELIDDDDIAEELIERIYSRITSCLF